MRLTVCVGGKGAAVPVPLNWCTCNTMTDKKIFCVSWMWNMIWLSNYNLILLEVLLKRKDSYGCVCFPHTTKWQIYFRPRPPTEEYLNPHFSAACLPLCVLSHAPALHTGHTRIQDKQERLHVIRPYLIISQLILIWPCCLAQLEKGENKGGIKKTRRKHSSTQELGKNSSSRRSLCPVLAAENVPVGRLVDVSLLFESECSWWGKHSRTVEDRALWHQVFSGKTASWGTL